MFKSQWTLILVSLFMVSCFEPTQDVEVKEKIVEDNFLDRVDSLLIIADEELENIIHHNLEDQKEHDELVETARKLNVLVYNYKKEIEEKSNDIVILSDRLDSTTNSLNGIIENQNYLITVLEDKLKYIKIEHREQVVQYESELFRLDDSLRVLTDSIDKMRVFIIDNVKESKRADYIIIE